MKQDKQLKEQPKADEFMIGLTMVDFNNRTAEFQYK